MKPYRSILQLYKLLIRVSILLLALPMIYYLFISDNSLVKILSIVAYLALLMIVISLINRWYQQSVSKRLFSDLDMVSYEQYIDLHQQSTNIKRRLESETLSLIYQYMLGNFDLVISQFDELLKHNELTQDNKNSSLIYRIRASIILGQFSHKDDLEECILGYDFTDKSLQERILRSSAAIYDILINKERNDYFDSLTTSNKFQELESHFYRAHNALIKGDSNSADKLFRDLVEEDDKLYIVKEAKRYLGGR